MQHRVVLGVGAGIAAYKACDLLRRLQERGDDITVVPTPSSLNFVGAATWEALSGKKVTTSVWEEIDSVRHVSLGDSCDVVLIAPATADLIARITHGRADDLLTTTVLATKAPVIIVPAMHTAMWNNPATVSNVATLRSRGVFVMDPSVGRLTGTDSGAGRFPTTQEIISFVDSCIAKKFDLQGKKILISAGGTREAIDPVRYIGNRSSGKQGIALAKAAARRGADVQLVLANADAPAFPGITVHSVTSASDMHKVLKDLLPSHDALIMAAAVADARPVEIAHAKIPKSEYRKIDLAENVDIVADLAISKKLGQVFFGFAAETANHLDSAKSKMDRKGLDAIYVNDVTDGAIFGSDQTSGHILDANGSQESITSLSKETLADKILDRIVDKLG